MSRLYDNDLTELRLTKGSPAAIIAEMTAVSSEAIAAAWNHGFLAALLFRSIDTPAAVRMDMESNFERMVAASNERYFRWQELLEQLICQIYPKEEGAPDG